MCVCWRCVQELWAQACSVCPECDQSFKELVFAAKAAQPPDAVARHRAGALQLFT